MNKSLVKNAADPEQVKQAAKEEKRGRQQELNDVFNIMSQPFGRRFMWRWLGESGIYRTSFTGNSTTFFNEGMRNIGLMLLGDINQACPELYLQMLMEAKKEEEIDNTVTKQRSEQ